MLVEDAAPPGPLEAAAPPPLAPPLDDAAPPVVPPLDDAAPPLPELLVPPVPAPGPLLEELADPGVLGAVVDEEDDDPPGTMIVSFSFVTVEVGPLGAAPGTTVVVSLRSHAERARAPIRTNR